MGKQGTKVIHAEFQTTCIGCMAVWQSAVTKMHHARASSECVSYSTLNALTEVVSLK